MNKPVLQTQKLPKNTEVPSLQKVFFFRRFCGQNYIESKVYVNTIKKANNFFGRIVICRKKTSEIGNITRNNTPVIFRTKLINKILIDYD